MVLVLENKDCFFHRNSMLCILWIRVSSYLDFVLLFFVRKRINTEGDILMFIDIHAHAYRIKPAAFNFCTTKELLDEFDKLKIDMGVVLPIVNPEIYLPQAVEDVIEMSEQYPDRIIPYCNVDPRAIANSPQADLGSVIRKYKEKGCKGIGEVMPTMEILNPMVLNLFAHAESEGLPLVYDGSGQKGGDFGLYDDPGLPQLECALQQFPNLKIFGHGPAFWSEIGKLHTIAERAVYMAPDGNQFCNLPKGPIEEEGAVPKLFRKYPNLHGDLSDFTALNAIARDVDYGPRFLTEFQDRLYFGTDMCFPGMSVDLCELLISWKETGKISKTVFQKIARDNAVKLLNL